MSKVAIVIAARNESRNIGQLVKQCQRYGDVVVCEGGSINSTAQVARSNGATVLTGLTCLRDAFLAGFRYALGLNYEYVVQMDAGFSHSPSTIPKLLAGLEDADLVIGSRFVEGGSFADQPVEREFLSWLGSMLVRLVTKMQIADLTSGFKAYRASCLRELNVHGLLSAAVIPSTMYAFQFELTSLIAWNGYRIIEVPITYMGGASRVSGAFIWEALKAVWRMAW